jgi:electron transport complex protein RnfE
MATELTAPPARPLDGLWEQNPALVQMLGLCPLMAITTTTVNGFALGVGTLAVLVCSNLLISALRHWLRDPVRLPACVLLIAALVTALELLTQGFLPELYRVLGLFIPLIITNCAILGRAESCARHHGLATAGLDGLSYGLGFLLVLTLLGAIREILGRGVLLSDLNLISNNLTFEGLRFADGGLLLMVLPPGAFIAFGFLVAGFNIIQRRRKVDE